MRTLIRNLTPSVIACLVLVMTFLWFGYSLHESEARVRETQRLLDEAEARNQRQHKLSESDRAELHHEIEASREALMSEIKRQADRLSRQSTDPDRP